MNRKKIIFSILTIVIILLSSVGIYSCYEVVETSNGKSINFSSNQILYDIFDNIYPLSFQLDNVSKKKVFQNILLPTKKLVMNFIGIIFYIVVK